MAAFFFWPPAAQPQSRSDELFSGPDILSRGTRPIGRSGGRPIRFRANLTFGTSYFGGLTRAGVESDLQPGDVSAYSGNLGFGVAGTRATPRSSTTGQYQGFAALFGNQVTFSGINQFGQFNHQRQVARRWTAFVTGMGTTQSTVLNGFSPGSFDSMPFGGLALSQSEAFDSRLLQGVGGAGLGYQHSARLSFTLSGAGAVQRRKSSALVDSNAYMANGEANYQLSRRTGVGAQYSFMTFFHKRNFGETYANTFMGTFNRVLSPRWSIGFGAGALRMEADRLRPVTVDPLITALTGQTSAVQAFHSVYWGLAARASINGAFRRSNVGFQYDRGANGGNGLVLSGQAELINAQYTYSGIRRTSLSVFALRNHFIPVLGGFGVNNFTTVSAGTAVGYRLTGFVHLMASAQLGRNTATVRPESASQFNRDRYNLFVGISFQPGDVPLVLW